MPTASALACHPARGAITRRSMASARHADAARARPEAAARGDAAGDGDRVAAAVGTRDDPAGRRHHAAAGDAPADARAATAPGPEELAADGHPTRRRLALRLA